jgi:SAM-dependent methyltransferase
MTQASGDAGMRSSETESCGRNVLMQRHAALDSGGRMVSKSDEGHARWSAPQGIVQRELLTTKAVMDALWHAGGTNPESGIKRMSFYQRHVVPRIIHLAMRQNYLVPFRKRVVGAAQGRVLEVGIGSGLNFPLYGATVTSVIGLEPSPALLRMSRTRLSGASVPITLLDASAEAIPLESASIDTVVTTWTLCTIPDAPLALTEMRRVLKPSGMLLFVEHGRAPEPGVARWQDRLDPLWSRIAGGCHLNREMDDLIAGTGFRIETLANARLPGPRTHTFLYEGCARPL